MAQHSPPASIGSAGSPYANRAVPAHNPRIVGPMPAHTPRTAGPMPRQTELLDLIEDYQEGGVWGIGLNLELSPPHHVLHVDNLVDIDGTNCNHLVTPGDELLEINGTHVRSANIDSIETLILGPSGSVVRLTLSSHGRLYEIQVQRHVPIQVWDRKKCWYALKTEFKDKDFLAENKIISVLEGMRQYTHDGCGNLADLLKDHQTERCTLGIHLSLPTHVPQGVGPGQIRALTLGGPAFLSGQVQVGDEILAVDGTPVTDADSVSALVRGSDDIGTTCTVTLLRNGETFDVLLIRGSSTRVRAIQKLFQLIETSEDHIKKGNLDDAVRALGLIHGNLWASESARVERESRLSERLAKMQSTLFNDITAAEKALHPMPDFDDPEVVIKASAPRVQRSAAPPMPPPQPAFDDTELKDLRKQLESSQNKFWELSTKCSKLSDINQLVTEENAGLSADLSKIKSEMRRIKDDGDAKLVDLSNKLGLALGERDAAQTRFAVLEQHLAVLEEKRKQTQDQNKSLLQKVADLHQAVNNAEMKMQTEMVLRSDFARQTSEFRAVQAKYEAVSSEMLPFQGRLNEQAQELEVLRADASNWKQAAKKAKDELIDLNQLLQTAGLGNKTDLITLGELLAGKVSWQKLYLTDVCDFLIFLNEPPTRTLEEAKSIIKVMNQEPPWMAEYLLQVRNLLHGPPELTLEGLKGIIDNREVPVKLTLEKKALMNQINELKGQLAVLLKELEAVCSDNTSLNAENRKLQSETHSLQGRVRDLARLNAELEPQFAALQQELSKRDADIRTLNTCLEEAENALAEERRKEASLERSLLMTKAELEEDEKDLAADKKLFAANDATMAALKQKVRDLEAALAVSRSKECLDTKADEPKEVEALAMSRSKATRAQRSAPPPPPPAAVSEPPPPPLEAEEALSIMMSKPKGSQAVHLLEHLPQQPARLAAVREDPFPLVNTDDVVFTDVECARLTNAVSQVQRQRSAAHQPPPLPPPSGIEEALPIMMSKPKKSQTQRSAAPLPPGRGLPKAAAPRGAGAMPRTECGIGLLLEKTAHGPGVHVKHVVPGGPAEMCGSIRPGDELLAVDGKSLAGVPLEHVFDMIIGQQGSQVTINILQDLSLEPEQLTLTRAFPVPATTATTPVQNLDNLDDGAHRTKSLSGQNWLSGEKTSSSFDGQSNTHGMTETSFRDTGLDFMTRGLKNGMKNLGSFRSSSSAPMPWSVRPKELSDVEVGGGVKRDLMCKQERPTVPVFFILF